MFFWALIFLMIALVAGIFGFGSVASASAGIARVVFAIALALLAGSLVLRLIG